MLGKFLDAAAEFAVELAAGGAEGALGAGADEVGDGLGLGEVEFAVEEGGAGEFAGLAGRQPRAKRSSRMRLDDERIAVAGDFEEVFAGGGGGRGVVGEDDLVEGFAGEGVVVAEGGVARGGNIGDGSAKDGGGERGHERAARADDGERGFARGRGDGGDGFGERHQRGMKDEGCGQKSKSHVPLRHRARGHFSRLTFGEQSFYNGCLTSPWPPTYTKPFPSSPATKCGALRCANPCATNR